MKWFLGLFVLVALLTFSNGLSEDDLKANVPGELKQQDQQPDVAEVEPLTNNTRLGRQLRRFHKRQFVRLNAPAGRVAADDLADEPEASERAVRRRQRVRRRNRLDGTSGSRMSSNRNKSKSKSKSKAGKRRKILKSGSKKRNSSLRRKSGKRKSTKAKKPTNTTKKPNKQPEADVAEVNYDDAYEEEIHKVPRTHGDPISVMIVETEE